MEKLDQWNSENAKKNPIVCMTTINENFVWIAISCDIFKLKIESKNEKKFISMEKFVENCHERPIRDLIAIGREIWSAQIMSNEIKIWDTKNGSLIEKISLPKVRKEREREH